MSMLAIDGVSIDSTEFTFVPGPWVSGGTYEWDIGTAGSTTMLAFSVLPLACFADSPVRARIEGGVFQDYAPSPYHGRATSSRARRNISSIRRESAAIGGVTQAERKP
jgi:hypothetical protein